MQYSVIIYDDDEVLRNSIKTLIELDNEFLVLASNSNPLDVLNDIDIYLPDVILMDIEMPAMNGVDAVKMIRASNTNTPILMLTSFDDNDNIYNALCAGANGYLLKNTSPEKLTTSIKDLLNGGAPMTSSIAKKVLQIFAHAPKETIKKDELTKRETELLSQLAKGKSYKMIASDLALSVETVRTHIKNIYKKLQVNNASGAVAKAINEKLI